MFISWVRTPLTRWLSVRASPRRQLTDTFRRLDKDGSGTLTEEDLNTASLTEAFGPENTAKFLDGGGL